MLKNSEFLSKDGEVYAFWEQAVPILSDMAEIRDVGEEREETLWSLIDALTDLMEGNDVGSACRKAILEKAFRYFAKDCHGVFEPLIELLLSSCVDKEDFELLSGLLETIGETLPEWCDPSFMTELYKQVGDKESYLAERSKTLRYAADYLDLAKFHRDEGDWDEAMSVAERGLATAKGSLWELRSFVIERLAETGETAKAAALRFDQFIESLSWETLMEFFAACPKEELPAYEKRIAETVKNAEPETRIRYFIFRRDFKEALRVFQMHGRSMIWRDDEFSAAEELEELFPRQMYECCMQSMGNLYVDAGRDEYERKARKMAAVRRILTMRLGQEKQWLEFARTVKKRNARRPDLQEEFARWVPGWEEL